ncbi:MAG: hypothetical protein ACR2IQ_02785 [Minisyncoccia bacterium]
MLNPMKEQEIREKWKEFSETPMWQNQDEFTNNIADFFLSLRKSELNSIMEEIEKEKTRCSDVLHKECCDDIIKILTSHIGE